VVEALSRIGQALDGVDGAASWSLSDTELREAVAGWFAVRSRVDAAWLGLVRDLDARPEAVAGARAGEVAKTFLVHRLHVTSGQAHTDVAAAQAITADGGPLSGLGAALAAGGVSRAHVDVAVRAVRRIPKRLLAEIAPDGRSGTARVDAYLTEQAQTFCPRTVEQLAARLLQVLDPDRADRYDPDAYTRRRLTCGTDSTGMTIGQYQLHPGGGAVFKAALDHYSRPAPGTTATAPDGQELLLADERTLDQRRADALVTIARIALHATANGTTPASPLTHITVIATPEQLTAAHHAQPAPAPCPCRKRTTDRTRTTAGRGRGRTRASRSAGDRTWTTGPDAGWAGPRQAGPTKGSRSRLTGRRTTRRGRPQPVHGRIRAGDGGCGDGGFGRPGADPGTLDPAATPSCKQCSWPLPAPSSTWAGPSAPPPPPNAGRSWPGTGAASCPAAPPPWPPSTSTTSPIGATAAQPTWTTW
jgi:hypothetical protein